MGSLTCGAPKALSLFLTEMMTLRIAAAADGSSTLSLGLYEFTRSASWLLSLDKIAASEADLYVDQSRDLVDTLPDAFDGEIAQQPVPLFIRNIEKAEEGKGGLEELDKIEYGDLEGRQLAHP